MPARCPICYKPKPLCACGFQASLQEHDARLVAPELFKPEQAGEFPMCPNTWKNRQPQKALSKKEDKL